MIWAEWDFSDTEIVYLEEACSASHKHGGDSGFGGPGQGLIGGSLERWISVDPAATLPNCQSPQYPLVV